MEIKENRTSFYSKIESKITARNYKKYKREEMQLDKMNKANPIKIQRRTLGIMKRSEKPAFWWHSSCLKSEDKSGKKKARKCDNVKRNIFVVFSDTDIPLRLKNSYDDFRSDDLNFYRKEHLLLLLPFSQLPCTHTHTKDIIKKKQKEAVEYHMNLGI